MIQVYQCISIILSCNNFLSWLQVLQLFQFSFLLLKILNHCEVNVVFQYININFKKISYIIIIVFMKPLLNLNLFLTHFKQLTSNFCDIAYACRLSMSKLSMFKFLIFSSFQCFPDL